jgi:predicted MFS family arabinose efflux permease
MPRPLARPHLAEARETAMTTIARADEKAAAGTASVPRGLTLLLAAACGLIAANIYYAQPLIGPISAALGLSREAAGLIVTMTQIGYGVGLLLIVPLGDLVENRKLVLCVTGVGAAASLTAALSAGAAPFLAAALFIGLGSVAVQILVPYAAHVAPEAVRGRVVGNVTSGLMIGIMLARPVSSFITALSGWRTVYVFSAAAMVLLMLVLARALPRRRPAAPVRYGSLLVSMAHLVRTMPELRRRALYQAFLFGSFSLFWTTVPLLLAGPDYRFSQAGIALFALAGVGGALAAPIAGRLADRGWGRAATAAAMLITAGAFLLTHVAEHGTPLALALLVAAAILVDFGAQGNVVLGYRTIFSLGAEYRGRLNGLYLAAFFTAGAIGSAVGAWAYAHGGWTLASWIGFASPVAALAYFLTERPPAA